MSFLVPLALLSVSLSWTPVPQGGQDPANGKPAILSPAEHQSLRDKLAKFLQDDTNHSLATGKDREKTRRAIDKSKDALDEAWNKTKSKGDLLGSPADLRAIFENCFLLKPSPISLGNLRKETVKEEGLEYAYFLPKSYKEKVPTRTLIVLPGTTGPNAAGAWAKPQDYFAATWDKSTLAGDTIVHLPSPPAGLELDPIPDWTREGAEQEEQRRIVLMWGTFSEVMRTFNVERSRVFLDCGRGACGFGLRFVTMFPDRFAGVVLRAPTEVDDLRLGSLLGMPVLLLKTAATAGVVDALQKRLEDLSPGSTTVVEAADEYPHRGSTPAIEAWLAERRRVMVPKRVVIEPNHDRLNKAYWVGIDTAELLATAPPDKKPRIEAEADRAANRITVKTVGVERFTLFLNDDLVDLDKEFTVVINDKAITERKTRNFRDLRERVIRRNDWEFLFPAMFTATVPK